MGPGAPWLANVSPAARKIRNVNISPLRELHESLGARLRPAEAGGDVLTYGDVPAEVAAGRDGALLFDRTTRGLISITGGESTDFLHRILANEIKVLEAGEGNRNMLLTGKGKVVQLFDLAYLGEGYLLSTAPGAAQALKDALDMYLFAEDVALGDESESYAPIEMVGPRALSILAEVLEDAPDERGPDHTSALATFGGSVVRLVPLQVAGHPGWRVEAGPGKVAGLWAALRDAGAVAGGLVAFDSLRADTVTGEVGRDISENVYPQEARLDDAFSLTKGCYIGQEVVAKIDTYGGLNKRLFRLRVSHDDPVAPGTRLMRDVNGEARDLGIVTTWAYSFAEDGGVVLGYVKRKHQEPGTEFLLEGTDATAVLQE